MSLLTPEQDEENLGEIYRSIQDQQKLRRELPIIDQASKSVVQIRTDVLNGTGVVLEGGIIATVRHVVSDASCIIVSPPSLHAAEYVGPIHTITNENENIDLALFPLPDELVGLVKPLRLADAFKSIEHSFLIGYPRSNDVEAASRFQQTILRGLSFTKNGSQEAFFPTIHPMPGFSGGPLLNTKGEILAILHSSAEVNALIRGCIVYTTNLETIHMAHAAMLDNRDANSQPLS